MGARVEALRAGGLTSSARRLAAACARGLRKRAAAAAIRWAKALPNEPGPSSSSTGSRTASSIALASHTDPTACASPTTAAPAPVGTCALTYNDRCLAQGMVLMVNKSAKRILCVNIILLNLQIVRIGWVIH